MALVERSTTLDAEPGSVRVARRFVVEALVASGHSDDVDTAELLVSELVTNAVLHARSRADLRVRIEGGRLRVEVRDTSILLPTTRIHHQESQTGRGLELVELLSDRWGAELDDGSEPQPRSGKAVWFELGLGRSATAVPEGDAHLSERSTDHSRLPLCRVCLEGVPLALLSASREHRDDLARELVLMSIDHDDAADLPDRLVVLGDRLSREIDVVLAQMADADQRGESSVDLLIEISPDAAKVIAEVVDLLEEADRFCAEGALLTLAASDEVRAFRRWCATEIATQLRGGTASRWRAG